MFKKDDVVTFKDEHTPLTVRELHELGGTMWIVAADPKGNKTWATEEAYHLFAAPPDHRAQRTHY